MRRRDRQRSGTEELIGGGTCIVIFGLLFLATHQNFWLFPLVFAGIPPFIRGIQRFSARRAMIRERQAALPTDDDRTKEILRVAQAKGGIVTPAIVTLNTSLSLEDAERLLQQLASKGYAGMNVTESGRVEYEFPEFLEHHEQTNEE